MAIKGSGGKTVCVTTDNGKTWIDLVTFSKVSNKRLSSIKT
jgi:hypothetical protein